MSLSGVSFHPIVCRTARARTRQAGIAASMVLGEHAHAHVRIIEGGARALRLGAECEAHARVGDRRCEGRQALGASHVVHSDLHRVPVVLAADEVRGDARADEHQQAHHDASDDAGVKAEDLGRDRRRR